MCGITGVFDPFDTNPVTKQELKGMTDIITHRGPDDEGYHIGEHVGLGHRRLSILDIEGGHQPVYNEDGSIAVIFNGEIYNQIQLKKELGPEHRFSTRCDTEVIPHAYERWGPGCVKHFNGMFAFALWDSDKKRLMLARDRIGIKPLYYMHDGTRLIFGSEIKAMLMASGVRREVDPLGLYDYLVYQYPLGERTLFSGIRLLSPGHYLVHDRDGLRKRCFWDLHDFDKLSMDETTMINTIERTFRDSVRMRLMGDVPMGSYLSGGVDSGLITAVASDMMRKDGKTLSTYNCRFKYGEEYDESKYARRIAKRVRSQHHMAEPSVEDMMENLSRMIWHLDEPRVNFGIFGQYMIAQRAAKDVKVIFTGHGGDELFGGYFRHIRCLMEDRLRSCIGILKGVKGNGGERPFSVLLDMPRFFTSLKVRDSLATYARLKGDTLDSAVTEFSRFDLPFIDSLLVSGFSQSISGHDPNRVVRGYIGGNGFKDSLDINLYLDLKTYLHSLLVVEDKMSMAHSIEDRVPFLDHRMVELAARIPTDLKLKNMTMKYLTKQLSRKYLPSGSTNPRKMGFPIPFEPWSRSEMRGYITEMLTDPRVKERAIFSPKAMEAILDDYMRRRYNDSRLIWSLLSLEIWFRLFIDPQKMEKAAPKGRVP